MAVLRQVVDGDNSERLLPRQFAFTHDPVDMTNVVVGFT
jgi:hypothetical protein